MRCRIFATDENGEIVTQPRTIVADDISQAWAIDAKERGLSDRELDMWFRDCATISEDRTVAIISEDGEFNTHIVSMNHLG